MCNLIKDPSRTVFIASKKKTTKCVSAIYKIRLNSRQMKMIELKLLESKSQEYPKASTNLNSFGMNARAVCAFTRWSWYSALKFKRTNAPKSLLVKYG